MGEEGEGGGEEGEAEGGRRGKGMGEELAVRVAILNLRFENAAVGIAIFWDAKLGARLPKGPHRAKNTTVYPKNVFGLLLTFSGKVNFCTGTGWKAFFEFFQPDSGPPPVHMPLQRKKANSFVPAIFFPMAWPF